MPARSFASDQYDSNKLEELFGYKQSLCRDPVAKKADNSIFSKQPNSVAIYSETRLWKKPGEEGKGIPVAILSLPAPALDNISQPNYSYYVQDNKLDQAKYQAEIDFLFTTVEKAVEDNAKNAFSRKGIKRVVFPETGQGYYLYSLSGEDKKEAGVIHQELRESFFQFMKEKHPTIPVVIWKPVAEEKELAGEKEGGNRYY